MSNKKKNNYQVKKQDNKKNKETTLVNPVKTVWGKILIFILAFAMCFGGLFTLIYLIITTM